MSNEQNKTFQSCSSVEEPETSGFIEDYSHLRLSYHREFSDTLEITDSSFASAQEDSMETAEEIDEETAKRNKLRQYWVSQMPDLPHPAVTMAGIIATASKKMGMVQLNYNDRIEQGSSQLKEEKFSPSRRSTMNCKKLPK